MTQHSTDGIPASGSIVMTPSFDTTVRVPAASTGSIGTRSSLVGCDWEANSSAVLDNDIASP